MTESKFGTKNAGTITEANSSRHIPVLLHEAIEGLNLKAGDVFVDGTLGSGGHTRSIIQQFGNDVKIVGIDRDVEALERNKDLSIHLILGSFRNIDEVLRDLEIGKVNAVLLDIGVSSEQIDTSGRGFSFQRDEPLEMTMQKGSELSAKTILNDWDEDTLELILRGFGEEKYSSRIAHEIVMRRDEKPFETTFDLVDAVRAATPSSYAHGKINPATRTFQAIRIAVNEELTALEEGLAKSFEALEKEGRLVVISFHSLEDRIVKNFMRDRAKEGFARLITKRPITASDEERDQNPRSRSAKLRILEKLENEN